MDTKHRKSKPYKILSNSYIFYFMLFFIGVFFDLIFPLHFLEKTYTPMAGLLLIVFGSVLIFWIKLNSKKVKKEVLKKEDFMQGPYKYTSIPNHWAIFVLILGFGIMVNAFFMIMFTVLSFFVTLPFFLKMQENVLVEKYGPIYSEYKKIVKF
jgi:protein-S-isoprenylcysteine O-methyltransferase Ste14